MLVSAVPNELSVLLLGILREERRSEEDAGEPIFQEGVGVDSRVCWGTVSIAISGANVNSKSKVGLLVKL